MPRLVFGEDRVCHRCVTHDRRKMLYGQGWYWWLTRAVTKDMIVVKRVGDWSKIQCPVCKGTGFEHR